MQYIMIAFYQQEADSRKIISPSFEPVQFFVLPAVKKIANDDQLFGLKMLNTRHQALQVFLINVLRNSNTGFSEMPGLAKMKIRKDQCLLFFPENTAMG